MYSQAGIQRQVTSLLLGKDRARIALESGYRFLALLGRIELLLWKPELIGDAADVAWGSRAFAFKNKVN